MSQVLVRDYAKWLAVFLAYPIAGALGRLIANPADGLIFAFITAAVAGAVLGLAQWLALGRHISITRWVGATAVGLGISFVIVQAFGATSSAAAPIIGALTGLGWASRNRSCGQIECQRRRSGSRRWASRGPSGGSSQRPSASRQRPGGRSLV